MKNVYSPQQLINYEKCGCDTNNSQLPPKWLLDKLAEEKMTGMYTKKQLLPTNQCQVCFIQKSSNGTCNCI